MYVKILKKYQCRYLENINTNIDYFIINGLSFESSKYLLKIYHESGTTK